MLVALGPGDDEEARRKARAGGWYNAAAIVVHAECGGGSEEKPQGETVLDWVPCQSRSCNLYWETRLDRLRNELAAAQEAIARAEARAEAREVR